MTPNLSARAETEYREHGFVVVRGMLAPPLVRTLTQWVDEIAAMAGRDGLYCYYEADGTQLRQMENCCAVHPGLLSFAESGAPVHAVSRLFGEAARLFKDKVNFKPPGGAGYEPHRDGRFWWTGPDGARLPGWDVYARDFISVLVGIDRSTRENGCLELVAGQHRRETIGEYGPLSEREAAGMTFVPCPTEPGDVIFFNALVPHRSGPNLTSEARRAIYLTYHPAADGDQRARYFQDKQRSLACGAVNR